MRHFNLAAAALAGVSLQVAAYAAVNYQLVPIGNAGNAADTTVLPVGATTTSPTGTRGSVAYDYKIGKFELTNSQYMEFLNTVDPNGSNSLKLWGQFTSLNTLTQGIVQDLAAAPGSRYKLKTATMSINVNGSSTASTVNIDFANKPAMSVTWPSIMRFCNWMSNGQGSGDTEHGSYELNGVVTPTVLPARNAGATWAIPTVDEWHKAAYYDPSTGSYWNYATGTDAAPGNPQPPSIKGVSDPGNSINVRIATVYAVNQLTTQSGSTVCPFNDVGDYSNSFSKYGTFDQNGNSTEWNAFGTGFVQVGSGWSTTNPPPTTIGGIAGGTIANPSFPTNDAGATWFAPSSTWRLAVVPEPASLGLVGFAAAAILRRRGIGK